MAISRFDQKGLCLIGKDVKKALSPMEDNKRISKFTIDEAKELLSKYKILWLRGVLEDVTLNLHGIEKTIVAELLQNSKKPRGKNTRELKQAAIDLYLLSGCSQVAFYLIDEYNRTCGELPNDEIRHNIAMNLIDKMEKPNYIDETIEISKKHDKYAGYWATDLECAFAYKLLGNFEKSLEYAEKSEEKLNKFYKNEKIANPFMLMPEALKGECIYRLTEGSPENADSSRETANKIFNNVLGKNYFSPDLVSYLADTERHLNDPQNALLHCAQSIAYDPKNVHPWKVAFKTYLELGMHDNALSFIYPIILTSENINQSIEEIRPLFEQEKGRLLQINFDEIPNDEKTREENLKGVVNEFLEVLQEPLDFDSLKEGEKVYAEVFELIKKSDEHYEIAEENNSPKDFEISESLLLKAEELVEDLDIRVQLFYRYFEMGFYDLAKDVIETAPYEFNQKLILSSQAENMLNKINNIKQYPLDYIEQALAVCEKYPNHWGAFSNLANAYKNYALKPKCPDKLKYLSLAYENYIEAEKLLNKSLLKGKCIIKPDYLDKKKSTHSFMFTPLFNQGFIKMLEMLYLQKLGMGTKLQQKEAFNKINHAAKFGFRSTEFLYSVGVANRINGHFEEASKMFNECIKYDKNYALAWLEKAFISFNAKKFDEAELNLNQAKVLNPELSSIAVLESALRQTKDAQENA